MKKNLQQLMEAQMKASQANETPREWEVRDEEKEYRDPHTFGVYDEPKPSGLSRKTFAIALSLSAIISILVLAYQSYTYRFTDEYKLTQALILEVNLSKQYNQIAIDINKLNDQKARTLSGIDATKASIEKLKDKIIIGK